MKAKTSVPRLKKSERDIIKVVLESKKPMRKMDMINVGIAHSTVMKGVDPLVAKGALEVVQKKEWKNKMPSRDYNVTIQGLLALCLEDSKYVLRKVALHTFFKRHGIEDLNVDALRGMLKICIFYRENAPRINEKVFYSKAEFPDAEFLSNVTRGIFFLVLGRTSPFAQIGEASFLTPNSLEIALRVDGKLSAEETEAVLLALYRKGIHLKNSEMALLSEALWEEKFGTSRKRDFCLAGFFPKEGNLFRVGAKLNPDILRDDIASGKKSLDGLKSIQDVKVSKVHRSKTET